MTWRRNRYVRTEAVSAQKLEADSLCHRYGARVALDGVSLTLSSGVTALVGINGAGKSTLLRALAGSQRPTSGAVRVGGKDPYRTGQRRGALAGVGLMPQDARLPPNLTVHEVVTSIGWLKGAPWGSAARRAQEVIEAVGLDDRLNTHVRRLSGGMVRRVALAQALVTNPDILLLDEPSTGLDPEQRRIMIDLVGRIESTVLFSSHVMEDIEDVADRVIVLEEGHVIFDGTLEMLRRRGAAIAKPGAHASLAESGFLDLLSETRRRS